MTEFEIILTLAVKAKNAISARIICETLAIDIEDKIVQELYRDANIKAKKITLRRKGDQPCFSLDLEGGVDA